MLKLLWPLLIVNLEIPGLMKRRKACFVQNNTPINLPGDTLRATSKFPFRTQAIHFSPQITSQETKKCFVFSLLQSNMVFGIVNPF